MSVMTGKEMVHQEKLDNRRRFGKGLKTDYEIACMVVDEIGPLLDKEIRSMLTPMTQYWLQEHEGTNYKEETDDRQSDSSSGNDGEESLGEGEETRIPLRPDSDSRILVEDTK